MKLIEHLPRRKWIEQNNLVFGLCFVYIYTISDADCDKDKNIFNWMDVLLPFGDSQSNFNYQRTTPAFAFSTFSLSNIKFWKSTRAFEVEKKYFFFCLLFLLGWVYWSERRDTIAELLTKLRIFDIRLISNCKLHIYLHWICHVKIKLIWECEMVLWQCAYIILWIKLTIYIFRFFFFSFKIP